MFLELAEGKRDNQLMESREIGEQGDTPYIYIPKIYSPTGEGFYLREDYFDSMPDNLHDKLTNILEPYQDRTLGFLGMWGKKVTERKIKRQEGRTAKKIAIIEAKTKAGMTPAQAEQEAEAETKPKTIDKVLGVADTILGSIFGGGGSENGATAGKQPMSNTSIILLSLGGLAVVTLIYFSTKKKKRRK